MSDSGAEIPVQAWLSYRCKDDLAKTRRDELKAACEAQKIRLVYDESDAKEGAHLIEFMADLTSASCVFIFLAPNYFESSYTLFELLTVYERPDLGQRFILPMRLSDDMVTYEWTRSKQFWDENEEVRNELLRLLKAYWFVEDDSHEAIWQRIDAAWHGVIFPYLDTLRKSLATGEAEVVLESRVTDLKTEIDHAIEGAESKLQQKVHDECCRILRNKQIPLSYLVDGFGLDTSAEQDVVSHMLTGLNIDKVLDQLLSVSQQRERELSADKDAWRLYLLDIEQLCGWLLIRSVDKVWWFQQTLSLSKTLSENIASEFVIASDAQAYVEVIISRNLLQQAQFRLDQYGELIPASESHDVLLFDAVSEGASDIELLTPVFKDLRRSPNAPQNVDKLLQGITKTVKALSGSRDGKPIYYLVTADYLSLLQGKPWYSSMNSSLAGYLHFVCCRLPDKTYELNPCQGDPESILEKVAALLRLRNPKEH